MSEELQSAIARRARRSAASRREPASAATRYSPAGPIVGEGPAMRRLQTAIDFVARSSAPVLVTGETGVGKELVARAIHARGRAARVARSSPSTPPPSRRSCSRARSSGTRAAAFTGAVQARKGLLDRGRRRHAAARRDRRHVRSALQAKLLRVLQFGDVRPVGSDRVHHVDVRVIASTHRDLPAMVEEGSSARTSTSG